MFNPRIVCLLGFAVAVIAVASGQGLGGVSQVTGPELFQAIATLQNSLNKLSAGEGPHYKISNIISATKQVVAGIRNEYVVELLDLNNAVHVCQVDIVSQAWIPNGIQVSIDCMGESKVVRQLSV